MKENIHRSPKNIKENIHGVKKKSEVNIYNEWEWNLGTYSTWRPATKIESTLNCMNFL